MTLKPRPLIRETATYRDDRLFIVACEDTYAPKQYFDLFRIPRVQVHVVPTEGGRSSPQHLLDRLLTYKHAEDDQRWVLLDIDHRNVGPHVANLAQTLSEARRQEVNVAICNPCFELWLLLHHQSEDQCRELTTCGDAEDQLRSFLGSYNKKRLQPEQFNPPAVAAACLRARRLDQCPPWSIPAAPAAQVHRLWEEIASKAAPHQLPPEFQGLRLGDPDSARGE